MLRSVYVRGLGIHGQYGADKVIASGKDFIKVRALEQESIEHVTASYFGNACTTKDKKLVYWGWQFCPVSAFRMLMFYSEIAFLAKVITAAWRSKNLISPPLTLFQASERIKKIVVGNAYIMALYETGQIVGVGSNLAVFLAHI